MAQPPPSNAATMKWLLILAAVVGVTIVLSKSFASGATAAVIAVPSAALVTLLGVDAWYPAAPPFVRRAARVARRAPWTAGLLLSGLLFASAGGGVMGILTRYTRCQSSRGAARIQIGTDKLADAVESLRDARETCGSGDQAEIDSLAEDMAVKGRSRAEQQAVAQQVLDAQTAAAKEAADAAAKAALIASFPAQAQEVRARLKAAGSAAGQGAPRL